MSPGLGGYVAFDVETTGLLSDAAPPPSVLCAVTQVLRRCGAGYACDPARVWTRDARGAELGPDLAPGPDTLGTEGLVALVDALWELCGSQVPRPRRLRVLAWNGVGYDLRVLHAHCVAARTPDADRAADYVRTMAWDSCDQMLCFAFRRGFPVKLSAVSAALPNPRRKTGDGADCARLWGEEDEVARAGVVRYCANDVEMTAAVLVATERAGAVPWVTSRGGVRRWVPLNGPHELTAPPSELCRWTFADNEWMRRRDPATSALLPGERDRDLPSAAGYLGWLERAEGRGV